MPASLTSRHGEKDGFIQVGEGKRRTIRFSSWYDDELVTAEGEKYLSDIDDIAIKKLREWQLVWSGWEGDQRNGEQDTVWANDIFGMRTIKSFDSGFLRLFVKSVVWRALASSRQEFKHLPRDRVSLDKLKNNVINNDPGDIWDCPIIVHQIVSKGDVHNHTPTFEEMTWPIGNGSEKIVLPSFRIYIQGMIVHLLVNFKVQHKKYLKGVVAGSAPILIVGVNKFENSRQKEFLDQAKSW
ncbi:hypothetical protein P4544_13750 [Halomonas sp. LY9]